jgi:hypothetical protein
MPEDEEHNGPPPVMDDQRKVTLRDDPNEFPVDSSHGPISFVTLECLSVVITTSPKSPGRFWKSSFRLWLGPQTNFCRRNLSSIK